MAWEVWDIFTVGSMRLPLHLTNSRGQQDLWYYKRFTKWFSILTVLLFLIHCMEETGKIGHMLQSAKDNTDFKNNFELLGGTRGFNSIERIKQFKTFPMLGIRDDKRHDVDFCSYFNENKYPSRMEVYVKIYYQNDGGNDTMKSIDFIRPLKCQQHTSEYYINEMDTHLVIDQDTEEILHDLIDNEYEHYNRLKSEAWRKYAESVGISENATVYLTAPKYFVDLRPVCEHFAPFGSDGKRNTTMRAWWRINNLGINNHFN